MAIDFNNISFLILLPFALFIVYFFKKGVDRLNKRRRIGVLILRSLLVLFIVLALAGLGIKKYSKETSTIFLVDLSESAKNSKEDYKDFIEKALAGKSDLDRAGIVTFGAGAEVETSIKTDIKGVDFQSQVNGRFTDIENALKVSRGLMPPDTMKRIVLMTDGFENLGDSLSQSELIKTAKIDFKVLQQEQEQSEEVQIDDIEIPERLYENQSFDIVLSISSNVKTRGRVTLYSDSKVVGERSVNIEKGVNRFVFKDRAQSGGFKSYKAVITSDNDTLTQNNEYSTFGQVEGSANVLLIDGKEDAGRELEKILNSANIKVDAIKDKQAPKSIDSISKYKSIIMSDVSLENVSTEFVNSLKTYVKDYGGGLVVTGGENSYALGGYYQTPLEEILPVDMEMKVQGEVPSLGLILVIDKSGSMDEGHAGTNKMEVAKDAAIKAVKSLKSKDQIGVVAFDGNAQWVVRPSANQNKEDIIADIASIRAGGGTSILPALNAAYEGFLDTDTKLKHVILLTDGQAERTGYDPLIEKMREEKITISTVAVGSDADTRLLETIALDGKGRYYFVDQYDSLPSIFTKETFLASKSYINNKSFVPLVGAYDDILGPFQEGIPVIDGYIGTSNKERAQKILLTDKGDPLLSAWQYGLGKTVAWTSDVNGQWTSNYLETPEGVEFLTNIVQSSFPRIYDEDLLVETSSKGDQEEILVKNNKSTSKDIRTEVNIITPDLETINLKLKTSKPGEFKESFKPEGNGVYLLRINQYQGDKLINSSNSATSINYSKEYNINNNQNRLGALVSESDGIFIKEADEVFKGDLDKIYARKDLSQILLTLALILLLLDIALRRLNIKSKRLERVEEKIKDYSDSRKAKKAKPLIDMKKDIKEDIKRESQISGGENTDLASKGPLEDEKAVKFKTDKDTAKKAKEVKDKGQSKDEDGIDMSRILKAKDKKKRK
nr:VWA domain-containing protein [Tissierella sp.]